MPLIGGGRVALSGRNGVLASLRSSKEEGQSNFTNPGHPARGPRRRHRRAADLRVSLNANTLWFDDTAVLEVARNQGPIDKQIGYDVSASLTWRPMMSQNIVLRASYATLLAGDGFEALFPDEDPGYFLLNAIFSLLKVVRRMTECMNEQQRSCSGSLAIRYACCRAAVALSRVRLRSRACRRARLRHRAAVAGEPERRSSAGEERGCLTCHTQTDASSMHLNPAVKLGCTDCHGGDASVRVTSGAQRGTDAYTKAFERRTSCRAFRNPGTTRRAQTRSAPTRC